MPEVEDYEIIIPYLPMGQHKFNDDIIKINSVSTAPVTNKSSCGYDAFKAVTKS